MNNHIKNSLKLVFSIVIVLILLSRTDSDSLIDIILQAKLFYIFMGMIVSCVVVILSAVRWHILIKRFTDEIKFVDTFMLICVSHFFNIFIPGNMMGDVIRAYKFKNKNISMSQGIVTVVVDRIIGIFAVMILAIFGILAAFFLIENPAALKYVGVMIAVSIVLLSLLLNKRVTDIIKPLSRTHQVLHVKIHEFVDYMHYYKSPLKYGLFAISVSMCMTILNCVIFYILALAIGVKISLYYFLLFVPIINIVSYIPVTHNGLGVREGMFLYLFAQVGLNEAQALGISLLYFVLILVMGILQGLIYFTGNVGKAKV